MGYGNGFKITNSPSLTTKHKIVLEHNNKKMLEHLRFETLGKEIDASSTIPEATHTPVSTKRYFASMHFKDDKGRYDSLKMKLIDSKGRAWQVGSHDGTLQFDKEKDNGEWLTG